MSELPEQETSREQQTGDRDILLIVDDVEMNRVILGEQFKGAYRIIEAENGVEALRLTAQYQKELAAILLDVVMPEMDGFQVLEVLGAQGLMRQVPVFLITSDDSMESMNRGYELGVMDIIGKPIVPRFVKRRVESVVELFRAREQLGQTVERQEAALWEKAQEIQQLNTSIIETLATAIEFRDCESGQHVKRIHDVTLLLLRALVHMDPVRYQFSEEQLQQVATAAIMHDVGKIAIPDYILNKPGRLTREECAVMKQHTIRGCELLDRIPKSQTNPIYRYAYDICRHHHERWDGRGYPDQLKGDEISIWAQVVSVADVYDALVSPRVYKPPYQHDKAMEMILGGECGTFNPVLMQCLQRVSETLREAYAAAEAEAPAHTPERAGQIVNESIFTFLSRIPGGIFRYAADKAEQIDYISQGLLELYGCNETEFRRITRNCFPGMVHPEDVERVQREIRSQIQDGLDDQVTYRIIRADGAVRWVEDRGRLVRDQDGKQWFYVVLLDITEKINYQHELERGNIRQQVLADLSNDIFFDIDCRGGRIDVFGDFEKRFGRPPCPQDFMQFRICGENCAYCQTLPEVFSHPTESVLSNRMAADIALLDGEGAPVWCRFQSAVLRGESGLVQHHIGRLLDLHELIVQNQENRQQAQHDGLTHLLNRATAVSRIQERLKQPHGPGGCMLLLMDVDNFKQINDTLGHPEGDRALRHLAQRLRETFREGDIVARFGGDEFIVFLPHVRAPELVQSRLEAFCSRVPDGYRGKAPFTCSIGGVFCDLPDVPFQKLYEQADNALYDAKRTGKGKVCVRDWVRKP